MKPRQKLSPTMMRTRYHDHPMRRVGPVDPKRLPALNPPDDFRVDAEWLAHVQAGRIAVR